MQDTRKTGGFTLSKLVAVLVVIGLGAGLTIAELNSFKASAIIKDMSELEKFEAAARTFVEKYDYLPGDLTATLAMQLQFTARNGAQGRGDGNGVVEGVSYTNNNVSGVVQTGEPSFFWEDLSSSGLIKEPFHKAMDTEPGKDITDTVDEYLPNSGVGKNDYIYVYSDKQVNYFGISAITRIDGNSGALISRPGLSVSEAYGIDKKFDDGKPSSGKVLARYINTTIQDALNTPKPTPQSCSDSVSGGYTVSLNNGVGMNCGLSFVLAAH